MTLFDCESADNLFLKVCSLMRKLNLMKFWLLFMRNYFRKRTNCAIRATDTKYLEQLSHEYNAMVWNEWLRSCFFGEDPINVWSVLLDIFVCKISSYQDEPLYLYSLV